MPSEKIHLALLDIRDNILAAQRFTAGMSADDLKNSQMHFYAVTRALEIVSEAARRLPDSFREKHTALPWKQIMGVGNIYRHNYDNVQEIFVWATVQDHLSRWSLPKFPTLKMADDLRLRTRLDGRLRANAEAFVRCATLEVTTFRSSCWQPLRKAIATTFRRRNATH